MLSPVRWAMRLNAIEIVVGDWSEELPTCRHLHYLVSFQNDAGEARRLQRDTLVCEHVLSDAPDLARMVAHAVGGLIWELPGSVALPGENTMRITESHLRNLSPWTHE
jgi:hypothetical protein